MPICPWDPFFLAFVCIRVALSVHGSAAVSDGVLACFVGAVLYTELCISDVSIYTGMND